MEGGHSVRAAIGISIFGNPLGSKVDFSGKKSFKAYGLGALHVKKISNQGSPLVCVDQIGMELIDLGEYLAKHLEDYEHIPVPSE